MATAAHKCLLCYKPLSEKTSEYHTVCSKKFFGNMNPPKISTTLSEIKNLARDHAQARIAVPGVQPKLSIDIKPHNPKPRISVVIDGLYILKAPSDRYPQMVELEDVTMHMASLCKIKTAEHGLVRLASGELAYITKRVDRKLQKKAIIKYAQEDLCQLSELLTEYKYNSSMEKVGRLIRKYSTNPGIDAISFLEINIFSFLVGNSDMHTKNFSILKMPDTGYMLSPAYDLIATVLLVPEDLEESALTINGKKSKLKRSDFVLLGKSLAIDPKAIEASLDKFTNYMDSMRDLINRSFLDADFKQKLKTLIGSRMKRLLG